MNLDSRDPNAWRARGSPPWRGSPVVILLLCWLGLFAQAAEPVVREPTRKELWVPSEHLEKVLKEHPNAVLLSPEQYEALIRDAGKVKPEEDPKDKPPVDLMVESLVLKGTLDPKAATIRLSGTLTLFSTSEEWAQLKQLWYLPLLSAHAEGTVLASLSQPYGRTSPAGVVLPQRALNLHVKGVGRHRLHIETEVPVDREPVRGSGGFQLQLVGVPGYVDVTFPAGLKPEYSTHHRRLAEQTWRYAWEAAVNRPSNLGEYFSSEAGKPGNLNLYAFVACNVRWRAGNAAAEAVPEAPFSGASLDVRIEESSVEVVNTFGWAPYFGIKPMEVMELSAGAEVISVQQKDLEGPPVACAWKQTGTRLEIEPTRGYIHYSVLITLRQRRDPSQNQVTLPHVITDALASAEVNLRSSEGVEILTPAAPFTTLMNALPKVMVRPAKPRLEVDADLVAKLEKDSVSLTRTLNLRTDRPVHELRVTLPAGEEFIRIESAAKDFEWKRVTNHLELRFPQGVKAAMPQRVLLVTRQKLLKAWTGPRQPELVKVQPLAIPEAVKVAGYNALAFDDAWRVALKGTAGLEDRDAQLSPVKGRMAWFSLRDWELSFEVERAEPVFSAEITAYALPRARTVEIEGQVRLDIRAAPLRSFQLKLPPASAKLLRMTSPLIGEQKLDDATGLWTYTLRQESTGTHELRFRLSLPAEVTATAEQTLKATLPVLEMPSARRFAGTWVIEANTDTQVSFETQSLQPLDVLRVPVVSGYQPRHRLIAAYTYSTGAHTLALTAKRHAHSELATLVVRKLLLTTVLSPDSTRRHEAVFRVRHTGEQFMPVKLPAKARLLSLEVEHLGAKPVSAAGGMIAISLPAGSQSALISVIYEEDGEPWSSAGEEQIQPPEFLAGLPVLETEWHVHAPNGRHYELGGRFMDLVESAHAPGLISRLNRWVSASSRRPGATESVIERARREAVEDARASSSGQAEVEAIKQRMARHILPQVQFSGASLEEAVEFLNIKWNWMESHEDLVLPKLSFVLTNTTANNPAQITLDLKDVPFIEALRYVTELGGVTFRLTEDSVIIEPHSDRAARLSGRVFKVTSGLVEKLEEGKARYARGSEDPFAAGQQALPEAPQHPTGSSEWWMEVLKGQGISFPAGARVVSDPDHGELIVRNNGLNLDYIRDFLSSLMDPVTAALLYPVDEPEFSASGEGGARAPMDSQTGSGALLTKMQKIVFPEVRFSNATIEEALEFLRVKNRDLDISEMDPTRKGVSFILKAGDEASQARITLDLKDVSLADAMRYVTELAGMKYKVEPYAVLVVPLTDTTTEQFTRVYKMPSGWKYLSLGDVPGAPDAPADPFAAGGKEISPSGLITRGTAVDTLKGQGIPFPAGASAVYNAVTGDLIVKNTGPNLDYIDNFVGAIKAVAEKEGMKGGTKTGLISLDLDLPTAGQVLKFSGHQAPEVLTLRHVSWERQLTFAMLAVLAGIGSCFRWARRRPWRSTFLVAVLLTLGAPLVLGGPALALANAFLFGWLLALVLRGAWWMTKDFSTVRRELNGKEAVV